MTDKRVVVSLMGGLGNQMFQYAAARALARRNSAQLVIDARTGFLRDKTYKRHYELDSFPIKGRKASFAEQSPFWIERVAQRLLGRDFASILRRPWGTFLTDNTRGLVPEAFEQYRETVFLRGYWSSEAYFADVRNLVGAELQPPRAATASFAEIGYRVEGCNSVAVGVRLFEEVPGDKETSVGGLVEMSYYNSAARLLSESVNRPEFFVFCTSRFPALDQLDFPGPIHFITHDNGYRGSIERLWLLSRCHNHIISNSTFYWWGAWLAEFERPETKVVAIDKFPNDATVPARWMKIKPDA